jgi:hypothetical protein
MTHHIGFTFSERGLKCRKEINETQQLAKFLTVATTLGTFFVTFYSPKKLPKNFEKTILTNANWDMLASALKTIGNPSKTRITTTIGILLLQYSSEISPEEEQFWKKLKKTYEQSKI